MTNGLPARLDGLRTHPAMLAGEIGCRHAEDEEYALGLLRLACAEDRESLVRWLYQASVDRRWGNPFKGTIFNGLHFILRKFADRLVRWRSEPWVRELEARAERNLGLDAPQTPVPPPIPPAQTPPSVELPPPAATPTAGDVTANAAPSEAAANGGPGIPPAPSNSRQGGSPAALSAAAWEARKKRLRDRNELLKQFWDAGIRDWQKLFDAVMERDETLLYRNTRGEATPINRKRGTDSKRKFVRVKQMKEAFLAYLRELELQS